MNEEKGTILAFGTEVRRTKAVPKQGWGRDPHPVLQRGCPTRRTAAMSPAQGTLPSSASPTPDGTERDGNGSALRGAGSRPPSLRAVPCREGAPGPARPPPAPGPARPTGRARRSRWAGAGLPEAVSTAGGHRHPPAGRCAGRARGCAEGQNPAGAAEGSWGSGIAPKAGRGDTCALLCPRPPGEAEHSGVLGCSSQASLLLCFEWGSKPHR